MEFIPDPSVGAKMNVARARDDVRGIAELLAVLAGGDEAHAQNSGDCNVTGSVKPPCPIELAKLLPTATLI